MTRCADHPVNLAVQYISKLAEFNMVHIKNLPYIKSVSAGRPVHAYVPINAHS